MAAAMTGGLFDGLQSPLSLCDIPPFQGGQAKNVFYFPTKGVLNMKCEKCKEKEATFYYSCSINGEKSEMHLCPDCAREEGLDYSPTVMFDRAFQSMFEDFFAPMGSRFPSFGSFGTPFGSIMSPASPRVRLRYVPAETENEQAAAAIPDDAGEEIRHRREREALKAQLEAAVKAEDFEKAITLRDKLREMEK